MRSKIELCFLLVVLVALSDCAGKGHRPIVDFAASPGKTSETYERDLADCQKYAESVSPGRSAAQGGAGGAFLGGVLSGLFAGIFDGSVGRGAAAGAAVGAVGGAVGGAASAGRTQEEIINNCMRGRGYSVLR